MRTFTVYRKSPPGQYLASGTANPPGEPQFEGVVFSDGTVAVRWLTEFRSTSLWDNLESLEKVHGHPEYDTQWVWSTSMRPAREGEGDWDDAAGPVETRAAPLDQLSDAARAEIYRVQRFVARELAGPGKRDDLAEARRQQRDAGELP